MRFPAVLLLAALPLAAQSSVKWEEDYASAVKRAQAEHKSIMMDLWTEWCPPCQYLRTKIFPAPESQVALAKYVPLSVMVEQKDGTPVPEGKKLATQFNLKAYPTLVILDSNGKEIRRQVGAFPSATGFAAWLEGK
ncbi:MAG TPA: thioredoxin family protein [Holophaga sp.]|nr:thioredoxin family protein [Holophaga sp.]